MFVAPFRSFLRMSSSSAPVAAAASAPVAAAASAAEGVVHRQPQHIPAFASYPASPKPNLQAVAPLASIQQGINGFSSLVIVRKGDAFYAMDALCPHKKGELVLGDLVDVEDSAAVICPRHRKKFPGGLHISCSTGQASCPGAQGGPGEEPVDAQWKVGTYATEVADGWLFVERTE
jgi:nitrite reductase/ring-hydroxylating ferredoxin subunit